MKKIALMLALILCVSLGACTFASCANNSGSGSGTEQGGETPTETKYKVTFKQEGQLDVVVEVKAGESVLSNEIPELLPKAGYTVEWENVDLTNITKNIIVNAVYTLIVDTNKEFTITLDYGSLKAKETVKAKQGEVPNLPETLEVEGWGTVSITWKLNNGVVYSGAYNFGSDITLYANYNSYVGN